MGALRPYGVDDLLDGELHVRAHRNEAPLPPPQHVVEAVRNAGGDALRYYPANLQRGVLHQLARRLGIGARNVAIANGADEILLAAARRENIRLNSSITFEILRIRLTTVLGVYLPN